MFERVLRLCGLYDRRTGWTGGNTVLVQIGDVLDRGGQEMECLRLLRTLKEQAPLQGGTVVSLLGNHEVMNAAGLTYMASPQAAAAFDDRASAFLVGGMLAAELSTWPVACVVGDTVFTHAALTSGLAAAGLDAANAEASSWLLGRGPKLPPSSLFPSASAVPSPLWSRALSDPPDTEPAPSACAELRAALATLGAARLVVGHTVQSSINCACSCSVYRIDVGLSAAMNGAPPQALEISAGKVRVLVESSASAGGAV